MVLCTRPTREHYKTAFYDSTRVTLLLQYFPWGLLTRKEKKEIINPFLNPRRGTHKKFQGEKIDNGSEKEERTRQGSLLQYEPFY